MIHYSKTQLGHDALKQRSLPLNARQRRLLVLIGTEDFESMNEIFKQRLAPPELIEQLSEMGLIMASSVKAMAEPEVQAVEPLTEPQNSPTPHSTHWKFRAKIFVKSPSFVWAPVLPLLPVWSC